MSELVRFLTESDLARLIISTAAIIVALAAIYAKAVEPCWRRWIVPAFRLVRAALEAALEIRDSLQENIAEHRRMQQGNDETWYAVQRLEEKHDELAHSVANLATAFIAHDTRGGRDALRSDAGN